LYSSIHKVFLQIFNKLAHCVEFSTVGTNVTIEILSTYPYAKNIKHLLKNQHVIIQEDAL